MKWEDILAGLLYPLAIMGAALVWFVGEFWLQIVVFILIYYFVKMLIRIGFKLKE